MKMDYVVVTKDDYRTLPLTISSIRRQPNVNRILVVQSARGPEGQFMMLDRMKARGDIDEIILEEKGLAFARWLGIQEVETDYFVFVDGDVVLNDDWYLVMREWYAPVTEILIAGRDYLYKPPAAMFATLARNIPHMDYLNKHEFCEREKRRMFTYDTIIKTEYVKDWKPPEGLNAYEDYHMMQHILKKGGVIWRVKNPSLHLHQGSDFKAAAWNAAGARMVGIYKNWKDVTKVFFKTIFGGIKRTFEMNCDWFAINAVRCAFGYMYGYFRYKKFIKK
jgi:glycosyltransferase involved in cell wall biosynthesis